MSVFCRGIFTYKYMLIFTCSIQGKEGNSSALLFGLPIHTVQKVFIFVPANW